MWKRTDALMMTTEQRRTLEAWVKAKTTPQRVVLRSRICLMAAEGISNNLIAKTLNTSRPTVILWRRRFAEQGAGGIAKDAPHGPSFRRLDPEIVKLIVECTLHTQPPGATHWSTRALAREVGVSHVTIARVWAAHGRVPAVSSSQHPVLSCATARSNILPRA